MCSRDPSVEGPSGGRFFQGNDGDYQRQRIRRNVGGDTLDSRSAQRCHDVHTENTLARTARESAVTVTQAAKLSEANLLLQGQRGERNDWRHHADTKVVVVTSEGSAFLTGHGGCGVCCPCDGGAHLS